MNVPLTQVAGLLSQSVMHLPGNLKYFAAGCALCAECWEIEDSIVQ